MEAGPLEDLFPFFSFDADFLEALVPSLLIFSFTAFLFIFALPRLRVWLKTRFEQTLTSRELPWTDFFTFAYYLQVTKFLDPLAIVYLSGTFLILLSVLNDWFRIAAFAVIFTTTAILLTRFIITVFIVLPPSRISVKVIFNFPIHLLTEE